MRLDAKKNYAIIFTAMLFILTTHAVRADEFSLDSISHKLQSKYRSIQHMPGEQLLTVLTQNKQPDFLLFDVREKAEYAVSHIEGAHQLDPSSWRRTVMQRYSQTVKDKTVIFYCSVGVRSSKMASALKADLLKAGAKGVYNLDKGLFGWANQNHPMVNAQGATPYIHPYDAHWGQLLTSKERWRYK